MVNGLTVWAETAKLITKNASTKPFFISIRIKKRRKVTHFFAYFKIFLYLCMFFIKMKYGERLRSGFREPEIIHL